MSPTFYTHLKSALIAAAGAGLAYLAAVVTNGTLDLGAAGPLVGAVLAFLVNALRVQSTPSQ